MKHLLLLACLIPLSVMAQAPAKAQPKEPAKAAAAAAPSPQAAPTTTPNFCTQSWSTVQETSDHDAVSVMPGPFLYAVPYKDVEDNTNKMKKVLDILSKEQNTPPGKGDRYTVTVTEVRDCDGLGAFENKSGGVYVEGVTLKTVNKAAREGLKQTDLIIKRYEERDDAGLPAWNHKNAGKMTVGPQGEHVPPGQAKKNQ